MTMVDLLFANGTVIDGTGAAGYRGSVAVTGDRVQVITGDTSAVDAGRVIDASGYVICPGFIDMHSHSDLKLLTGLFVLITLATPILLRAKR